MFVSAIEGDIVTIKYESTSVLIKIMIKSLDILKVSVFIENK